jgi:hypothetical protein
VTSRMELSGDGKALNFFEVAPFDIALTPEEIAEAVRTLSATAANPSSQGDKHG